MSYKGNYNDNINDEYNSLSSINNINNISNSINNLSINDSENSNKNNKIDDKSYNKKIIGSNLISSNSTQYSSLLDLENNEKIFEYLYEDIKQNKLKNSIIILDKGEQSKNIYEKIINNFNVVTTSNKNINKICFLILDSKKLDKLSEDLKLAFTDKKISILKGGKGKKMKSDYDVFKTYFEDSDIFIAIPDVFYKLLSIGFIKIYQFSLLFLDDCHTCEGNHPYNIIMQEFYYYYFYRYYSLKILNNYSLPNIIGFSDYDFLYEKIINKDDKSKKYLTNISENLNCQIIISPKILEKNNNINNDENIEYIVVKNHLNNENIDIIYEVLKHYFIEKALELSFKNFISKNKKNNLEEKKVKNIMIEKYPNYIHQKFYLKNKEESIQNDIDIYVKNSNIFKIFEHILDYLILIFQNFDLDEIISLFNKYFILFENIIYTQKNSSESININLEEIKYFQGIIKDCLKAFQHLLYKNIKYNNDRIIKLLSKLELIYNENKNSKIIIFVPFEKLAFLLNDILKRNKYISEYIIDINTNDDLSHFSLLSKTTYNLINEINQKYISGDINILVSTPSIIEFFDIDKCDYIIVFKELSNQIIDYTKIKKLSTNIRAKLIVFSTESMHIPKFESKSSVKFQNNEIVKDFRRNDFIQDKIKMIEKNSYYFIEETHAKVSIKNSIMLFNDINNWFISQNIKIIVNKFMDEYFIGKVKKYKFKIELDKKFGDTKIFSHSFGDKQTSEGDGLLQLIGFLHKFGVIDNHLRIIEPK